MVSRADWLNQGIELLGTAGAQALRIDRLCAQLGVTKGSFHHHFDGMADYKQALLNEYQHRVVAALHHAVTSQAGDEPSVVLASLTSMMDQPGGPYRPELEVAVRAWAFSDSDARKAQQRIDEQRIKALEGVWSQLTSDQDRIQASALLPYLVAVGASMLFPPVPPETLRKVYALLLDLVPSSDRAASSSALDAHG